MYSSGKNVPEIKILSDKLLEKYPEIVSSVINVNNRDTNVILGDEEIVLTSKTTFVTSCAKRRKHSSEGVLSG